jgi:hypothetical protein
MPRRDSFTLQLPGPFNVLVRTGLPPAPGSLGLRMNVYFSRSPSFSINWVVYIILLRGCQGRFSKNRHNRTQIQVDGLGSGGGRAAKTKLIGHNTPKLWWGMRETAGKDSPQIRADPTSHRSRRKHHQHDEHDLELAYPRYCWCGVHIG